MILIIMQASSASEAMVNGESSSNLVAYEWNMGREKPEKDKCPKRATMVGRLEIVFRSEDKGTIMKT